MSDKKILLKKTLSLLTLLGRVCMVAIGLAVIFLSLYGYHTIESSLRSTIILCFVGTVGGKIILSGLKKPT